MYHRKTYVTKLKAKYCPKKCKYCKEWYEYTLKRTKTIKDKELKKNLLDLWKILWLNSCTDFDIIAEEWATKL